MSAIPNHYASLHERARIYDAARIRAAAMRRAEIDAAITRVLAFVAACGLACVGRLLGRNRAGRKMGRHCHG